MTIRRGIKYASVGMAGLLATAILFTVIFATYNRLNFPGHIYPWAEPDSYDDILALARRGEAEKALNAVQDIKHDVHGSVREPAMRDVVGILVERGQIREVREFAARLRDRYEANVYLIELAKIQAEAGDVDGALESVGAIAGSNDIAAGLYRVAIGAARSRNIDRALTIARGMESADDRAVALNSIGLTLAENGELAAGREIIEESLAIAQSITVEPSNRLAVTRSAIAIAKLGDWQYAAELAATLPPADGGAYVLSELAQLQFKTGALKAARDTAQRVVNVHYRNRALETIMQSQLEDGDLAGALETAAIIPAGAERDEFLSTVVHSFPYAYRPEGAKVDVTETAVAVADTIKDEAPRDWVYVCLASFAASEIDMIGAIRVILAIENSEIRSHAVASSAEGFLYGYSYCTPYS